MLSASFCPRSRHVRSTPGRAVGCSRPEWPHNSRKVRHVPGGISGGDSVVVVQQSAQTPSPFYLAFTADVRRIRADQLVIEPLMVAFSVIVHREFGGRSPNRAFAKQD